MNRERERAEGERGQICIEIHNTDQFAGFFTRNFAHGREGKVPHGLKPQIYIRTTYFALYYTVLHSTVKAGL